MDELNEKIDVLLDAIDEVVNDTSMPATERAAAVKSRAEHNDQMIGFSEFVYWFSGE